MTPSSDAANGEPTVDGHTDDTPGFSAAMEELNGIVAELETDALDVDQLAARVARAAELVQLCRARIDGARFAVEEILAGLEGRDDEAETEG